MSSAYEKSERKAKWISQSDLPKGENRADTQHNDATVHAYRKNEINISGEHSIGKYQKKAKTGAHKEYKLLQVVSAYSHFAISLEYVR